MEEDSSKSAYHLTNNDKYILTHDKPWITCKALLIRSFFMKRSSTIFLQVVIVLMGVGALAFVLLAPQKNAGATLFEKYFNAFVAYTYAASIPFFVALFQAFKLLG